MHVMFIRNMANVPRWGEYLNKNVKSNVFMRGLILLALFTLIFSVG
jgi:hypothetical protein